MYLSRHPNDFGCCPPVGSVYIKSLFNVVPIVCGGYLFGPFSVMQYLESVRCFVSRDEAYIILKQIHADSGKIKSSF